MTDPAALSASPTGPPAGLVAVATAVFGPRLPVAVRYAELLATTAVERGLIGPREEPRLWERHLLNCAVIAELIPPGHVIDVGSGAGLPGLVLAIARPDLRVTLLEPLGRRAAFLSEVVDELRMAPAVSVVRGRAEDFAGQLAAPVVTARAVAPLDRLARWCLPLCTPGGRLIAMKGSSARDEIVEHAGAVRMVGGGQARIVECGRGVLDPPATVVEIPLVGSPRHVRLRSRGARGGRPRGPRSPG